MPRYARETPPGALIHLIARFVNRAYRIDGDEARTAYLERIGPALARSDWTMLGYAVLSTHLHLATIAGSAPLEQFSKSLHIGFALWLNHRQMTFGPVFAERPTTIAMEPDTCARLLAYIHNNPVRARVVEQPAQSSWTSHRAYAGLEEGPSWLAVERGLTLSGFDANPAGRHAFHAFVCSHADTPRDPVLSGDAIERTRATVRAQLNAPVELGTGQLDAAQRTRHAVVVKPETPLRPRTAGTLPELLAAVSAHTGISVQAMQSRDRSRAVVRARRHVLVIGYEYLGWSLAESAAAVGLARSSASELVRSTSADVRVDASVARAIVARFGGQRSTG